MGDRSVDLWRWSPREVLLYIFSISMCLHFKYLKVSYLYAKVLETEVKETIMFISENDRN